MLEGLKVGAYVRVSEDRGDDAEAVGRQERDTAALIARHGGTVAQVYSENDTSAYKKRRVRRTDDLGREVFVYRVLRPVYQAMLADLRAGVIDAAVVYDIDRLARDPRDLEDAIEVVEHHHRPILGATGGLDLLTDNGRAMARVLVAMANKASADTARRVKRKHLDNAERGIPVGGTAPFGWQADKRKLDPSTAPLVVEAASRVLTGAPLSAIVIDWNKRGIRTSRGNDWTPSALGGVLINPRVCGYSARNMPGPDGQPVLSVVRVNGEPVRGVWDPILSVEEWEALCVALAPKASRPGGNVHKYLLSGLLACGKCGGPMRGLPRPRRDGTSTYAYQCHSRSLGGCGGVSILGPDVDELVTEALFRRYERNRPQSAPRNVWDGQARLDLVQRNLADATAAWRAGDLDSADYFSLRRELGEEEKALRVTRAAVLAEQASAAAAPDDLHSVWLDYSLSERRSVLLEYLVAIEVKPLPEPVSEMDDAGRPLLGRSGKPKRSRPRDENGRVLGTALEDRVQPVWRSAD